MPSVPRSILSPFHPIPFARSFAGTRPGAGLRPVVRGGAKYRLGTGCARWRCSGILVILLLVTGVLRAWPARAQQANWRTDFFEVAVGAPDVAWLYGTGRLFHSADGGRTWTVQLSSRSPTANGESPEQIQFLDAQTGWVLFSGSLLHRTSDGGRTWQAIPVRPRAPDTGAVTFLGRIAMVSPQVGFGLNDNGEYLLRTTDGGLTWRSRGIQPGHSEFSRLSFVDERRGWASAEQGLLATTSNGGQTWQLLPAGPTNGAIRLQFRSAQSGWFQEAATLPISRTQDGGQSWQACGAGPPTTEINGFYFLTPTLGWAAADRGIVLRTTDGCASWQAIQTPIDKHLRAVHFLDAHIGWAAGNEDGVVKSTDGGLTWSPVEVNVP